MNRTINTTGRLEAGLGSNVVDSNRFYSMLLDARTSGVTVTENMYDVAEKLLKGEKENAKVALDQLWTLKKTLTDTQADNMLEHLITHYQEKIDALREKEENIKKVSNDMRTLIEEKRMKDEELSTVKSQIGACTRDLKELNVKLDTLKKREDELVTVEQRLKTEIRVSEGRIVNGLYEIILRQTDEERVGAPDTLEFEAVAPAGAVRADAVKETRGSPPPKAVAYMKEQPKEELLNKDDEAPKVRAATPVGEDRPFQEPVAAVFPKSVVRMGGKIIGEYYHDGNVATKERRHYIYNSRFMADRLSAGLRAVKTGLSQDTHAELIKVAEDAANRVRENARFHFEVSTNEILNEKNLKQLSADLRRRAWDDAERLVVRLNAKIEALGHNYLVMLQEQMERCLESV